MSLLSIHIILNNLTWNGNNQKISSKIFLKCLRQMTGKSLQRENSTESQPKEFKTRILHKVLIALLTMNTKRIILFHWIHSQVSKESLKASQVNTSKNLR